MRINFREFQIEHQLELLILSPDIREAYGKYLSNFWIDTDYLKIILEDKKLEEFNIPI